MKSKSLKIFLRVIALVLVAALIGGMFVFDRTTVRLKPESVGSDAGRYAARTLLEGSEYANAGRLARMGIYTRSLLSGRDSAEECFEASQIALAGGDVAGALRYSLQALSFDEGSANFKGRLMQQCGFLYLMLDKPDEAVPYLDAGMSVTGDADTALLLAWLGIDAGDTAAAKDYMAGYISKAGVVDALAGPVALLIGDGAIIRDTYARLYEQDHLTEHLIGKGYGEYRLGDIESAATSLETYMAQGGEDPTACAMAAIVTYNKGDCAKALELFEKAKVMGADEKLCTGGVVICGAETGDYAKAAQAADAYAAAPEAGQSAVYILNLPVSEDVYNRKAATVYAGNGEYEKAEALFAAYIEAQPDDAAARRVYAGILIYLEKYEAALHELERLDGDDAELAFMKGVCLSGNERSGEAEAFFQSVVDAADASDELKAQALGCLDGMKTEQAEESR